MNISGNEITGVGSPDVMFGWFAVIVLIAVIAGIAFAIYNAYS